MPSLQAGWSNNLASAGKAPSRCPQVSRVAVATLGVGTDPRSNVVALTGAFILASTTARTSDALLGWNCGYTFANNVMYGTLYALSPEIFPAKDRGTGNALVSAANRVFGIMVGIRRQTRMQALTRVMFRRPQSSRYMQT